jgi:hypothetical protein
MKTIAPGATELRRYLKRGLTQAQIVAEWEKDTGVRVSRSTIAMAIARYGLQSAKPRPRYEDTLPWKVLDEHKHHIDARMLRLEGRRRHGGKLTADEKRWLTDWKRLLDERGAVVMYDPDTPQGFYWVNKKEEDGNDIIRRPQPIPRSA